MDDMSLVSLKIELLTIEKDIQEINHKPLNMTKLNILSKKLERIRKLILNQTSCNPKLPHLD